MKITVETITVNSFKEYEEFIYRDTTPDIVLYRGQRVDKPILPKVARIYHSGSVLDVENKMFEMFRQRSLPFIQRIPETDWDWLAIAQHHGMPTRLLDWSSNPLMALWFTVSRPADKGANGVVWVFTPKESDFFNSKGSPFLGERTKVFRPNHVAERIRVQSGYFTVHKYIESQGRFVPFENIKRYKPQITKLIVPPESFSEMRYRLDQHGVNQAVVFPDLDGLCSHIGWLYSSLNDERNGKLKSSDMPH